MCGALQRDRENGALGGAITLPAPQTKRSGFLETALSVSRTTNELSLQLPGKRKAKDT